MRNLRRRIETLEKCISPTPKLHDIAVQRALVHLSDEEFQALKHLITTREANPRYEPTEAEDAANRAAMSAFEFEIQKMGFRTTNQFRRWCRRNDEISGM
jgi:hypothetical protein